MVSGENTTYFDESSYLYMIKAKIYGNKRISF